MPDRRPTVFIGSSTEGLAVAEAIQLNLDYACETVIWSQGVFGLSGGTLETLVEKLDAFDFAILVLTPDDLVHSRGGTQQAPRDNVLLELGLCIGALGRNRTFVVYERTADIKIPTDMAGVTPATYQPPNQGTLQSALGASCTLIKGAIQDLGIRVSPATSPAIRQDTQFQIIRDLLDATYLQFIILMHEQNVVLSREPFFGAGPRYEYWMKNLSGGVGHLSVNDLCRKLPDADLLQQDLRNNLSLTERGHEFATWLIERGHKAEFFDSQVGGWGTRPKDIPESPFPVPPNKAVNPSDGSG